MLEKILKSIEPFTTDPKSTKFCIDCGSPATKLATYSTEGAVILERYCEKCASKIKPI
ncbi:MAG TPA: hypothetical protein VJS91_06120 [Nitrososphaeraceae archaeon]|nr:hypothetical protein [Nitrososphaeraceae archaeon]